MRLGSCWQVVIAQEDLAHRFGWDFVSIGQVPAPQRPLIVLLAVRQELRELQ